MLGCTHYAFASDILQRLIGPATALLDAGQPVAKQTRRVLAQLGMLANDTAARDRRRPGTHYYSTGNLALLNAAVQRWLHADADTQAINPPQIDAPART